MNRLKGHGAQRDPAVEKKSEVRVEVPCGLGQTDEDIRVLIEAWIVPQLIRMFINETIPQFSVHTETSEDSDGPSSASSFGSSASSLDTRHQAGGHRDNHI